MIPEETEYLVGTLDIDFPDTYDPTMKEILMTLIDELRDTQEKVRELQRTSDEQGIEIEKLKEEIVTLKSTETGG